MKITQRVIKRNGEHKLTGVEFEHKELATLANISELARRFMQTRENGYVSEFGDEEACNIRDLIQRIFDLSKQFP